MRSLTQAKSALQPQKIQKSSIAHLDVLLSMHDLLQPGRIGLEYPFKGEATKAPAAVEDAADGALADLELIGKLNLRAAVAQLWPDGVCDLVKDVVMDQESPNQG